MTSELDEVLFKVEKLNETNQALAEQIAILREENCVLEENQAARFLENEQINEKVKILEENQAARFLENEQINKKVKAMLQELDCRISEDTTILENLNR